MKKQFHTENGITERELAENETSIELRIEYMKNKYINDNLPEWNTVGNAIDNISNLNEAKVFIRKLARVVYWLAKNEE